MGASAQAERNAARYCFARAWASMTRTMQNSGHLLSAPAADSPKSLSRVNKGAEAGLNRGFELSAITEAVPTPGHGGIRVNSQCCKQGN